jgi:hypothetical protein
LIQNCIKHKLMLLNISCQIHLYPLKKSGLLKQCNFNR